VTKVSASQGRASLEHHIARDEGARRLGELALVDGSGRVGETDTVFFDTLLDENAASHVALGNAYEKAVSETDLERINRSVIHTDFMIGGAGVDVLSRERQCEWRPLLVDGRWMI